MNFELLQSEVVFHGRVFNVRRDHLSLPDGKVLVLDIVTHHGSVVLVPVDGEGKIWFVRQYRHSIGEELLELPAGVLSPGESAEDCALREIREEIGMSPEGLQRIGEFYLAPGYSTECMQVYLAQGLYSNPLLPDEGEYLQVVTIPVAETYKMVMRGELRDTKSLAALHLSRSHLIDKWAT
ncbi:MAG: NUDIX hydrolase [Chloroflexota bacterium]